MHWGLPCIDERTGKEDFSGEGSQEEMSVLMRGQEKLAGEEKSVSWPAWQVWCGQRWTGWNMEEMEAELGQAGPRRPHEHVSILSEGNREPLKASEQGWSKIPTLLVVVGWRSEGAAAGIRERCQVLPMMLPVGADGRVCWGSFLKTKPLGVDDQFHVGVRGRCGG